MNFGFSSKFPVSVGFEKIDQVVREELKTSGFGVLTEIDVKETMKKKINEDYEPYVILGACNPTFANKVLKHNPEIGLLLPCNVVIYQKTSDVVVSIVQPLAMFSVVDDEAIKPIAEEVGNLLTQAMERIQNRLKTN